MSQRASALLLAVPVLLVCGGGCEKIKNGGLFGKKYGSKPILGEGGGDTAGQPSEKEDDRLAKKLNRYIDCINSVSGRALDSRNRYYSWLKKPEVGPTGKERIVYGLYTLNDPSSCLKGLAGARESAPELPALDKAGAAWAETVEALVPLLNQANEYYQQKDYLDDKFARGKEMHPALHGAFESFAKANRDMRVELDKVDRELKARELARMEQKLGRGDLGFQNANFMHQAEASFHAAVQDKPDLADVTAHIEALDEAHAEMRDVANANPAQRNRIMTWSFFESAASSYVASAKARLRRIRDKKGYSSSERSLLKGGGAWMVEGSPARVLRDYNQLVNASNRLRF